MMELINRTPLYQKIVSSPLPDAKFFARMVKEAPEVKFPILECDGYKMFKGTMKIKPPQSKRFKSYPLEGVWLYRPDTNCWYCSSGSGRGFLASCCERVK